MNMHIKSLLKKRSKKAGAAPGTLIYTGDATSAKPALTVFIYNADAIIEKHPQTIAETFSLLQKEMNAWIHISGIHDASLIHAIGKQFQLHPLLLEDIMSPTQRSKLDDYKSAIYIATHALYFQNEALEQEQISLVITERTLISFSEKPTDLFKPIHERLLKPGSRMRQRGPDYIAYTILDCIVDNYFVVLEQEDEKLSTLETALLSHHNGHSLYNIQLQKRELMTLRKTIWPMRELISQFRRMDSPLVSETTQLYLYDIYDHTIQAIETVESFRDLTGGLHEIYVATINQKMNETMRLLTVVATIFVPLTFITSLYGMNFDYMPELHHTWGYPAVLIFMALISLVMLIFFRKKKWI